MGRTLLPVAKEDETTKTKNLTATIHPGASQGADLLVEAPTGEDPPNPSRTGGEALTGEDPQAEPPDGGSQGTDLQAATPMGEDLPDVHREVDLLAETPMEEDLLAGIQMGEDLRDDHRVVDPRGLLDPLVLLDLLILGMKTRTRKNQARITATDAMNTKEAEGLQATPITTRTST